MLATALFLLLFEAGGATLLATDAGLDAAIDGGFDAATDAGFDAFEWCDYGRVTFGLTV